MGYVGIKLKKSNGEEVGQGFTEPSYSTQEGAISSPDDRLDQALKELRQSAQSDLIEALGKVSPTFFESVVLDLLHRMGYGATREDLQRVGGSGDAGIDGIISLDKLGLEKVYVQAKRWQNSVGRPELQAFYGALAGHKARKGVFITTSAFTAQAIEFARSVEGIVLVDGNRLASLMIEHEVGIGSRTVRIPKIDSDYFDEEATCLHRQTEALKPSPPLTHYGLLCLRQRSPSPDDHPRPCPAAERPSGEPDRHR